MGVFLLTSGLNHKKDLMDGNRVKYPTDVTDAEWVDMCQVIPAERPVGASRKIDMRSVVNAIFYRRRARCPWRLLPREFPHWRTVYGYHQQWEQGGVLRQLEEIQRQHRGRLKPGGSSCDPSDSASLPA